MKWKSVYLVIITASLFTGCSVSRHYRVLSFFFDGVPKLETRDSIPSQFVGKDFDVISDSVIVQQFEVSESGPSIHPPYGNRKCDLCHESGTISKMQKSQPELCYSCHEDQSIWYRYLHGPAAGRYCTACHNPHRSEEPKLLRYKGQSLCLQCHEQEQVLQNKAHEGLGETNCLECHNAHGGDNRYFIK